VEFTEQERKVFGPYWNGVAKIYGDPLTIDRRMRRALEGDPNEFLAIAKDPNQPESERFAATERVLRAAEFAFSLQPFDPASGQGSTEEQVREVLQQFSDWVDQKKTQQQNSQTCSPVTEECQRSSPTRNGSAYTSTSNVSV
jgi:hypothetical protein